MEDVKELLRDIARGACFLGSGGGGGYQTAMKFIDNFKIKKNTSLKIVSLEKVKNNKKGIVVAYMGAPEKMGTIRCPDAVVAGIHRFLDEKKLKKIDYIVPVEIGPISSITACLTAMRMDIPILDLDGAGRAVPTLDLITYSTNGGISVNPTILSSENIGTKTIPIYNQIKLAISDDRSTGAASKMESLARPVLTMSEFDQKAGLVMWFFDDVKKQLSIDNNSVYGTLTICKELGSIIRTQQCSVNPNFREIESYFNKGNVYEFISKKCSGKLKEAQTSTMGGFDVGTITIESDNGRVFRILFQNESLILWDSDSVEPLSMAPDLISFLIEDKTKVGEIKHQLVYTNDDIMENGALKEELVGTSITVYGIRAPKELRETEQNSLRLRKLLQQKYADATSSILPNHYMSILQTLGYYGKYKQLTK